MDSSAPPSTDSILIVTAEAKGVILDARSDEVDADQLALWLEVNVGPGGSFAYDMYFQATTDARPRDAVIHHDDIRIVVPEASIVRLQGSTLDVDDDGGMLIVNPNEPKLPQFKFGAELVGLDGLVAYMRMGGGCQGCGMAKATMSQGIEVAVRRAAPEIERIVDVTDHASGTNPYYQAAKK